jgi:hypothetical protein
VVGGAIWFVRAHNGANINATIPLYAWIAILMGVAVHRLLERWEAGDAQGAGPALLWMALAVQLFGHAYRPGQILPTAGQLAAREWFIASLKATPGDVWMVNHSYDGLLAGKPMHPDMDAFDAIMGRHSGPAVEEFNGLMKEQHFSAGVLDRAPEGYKPDGLFTAPPFGGVYDLRTAAAGTEGGAQADQPQLVMLPCAAAAATAPQPGLLNVSGGFVDRTKCR